MKKMSDTDIKKIESVYDSIIRNVNTFVVKYLTIDHKKDFVTSCVLSIKILRDKNITKRDLHIYCKYGNDDENLLSNSKYETIVLNIENLAKYFKFTKYVDIEYYEGEYDECLLLIKSFI